MATQGSSTNRITLRIGVLLDDKMALAQGEKVRANFDNKFSSSMKKQTSELKNQEKALGGVSKEVKKQKTFVGELRDGWSKTIANFVKFTVMAGVFMAITVSIKQMKDLIFELDKAMTNLSIVTSATEAELAMVDKRATALTTTLGALKGEVINSITEFARAGYELSDAMFLAERATMAANVGFTELDKITTFIIAGLKSFKLEAEGATRIMDVLFRVSNKTAIDLEGIGEAFLRSANTLKVAGATLEESASLIAAANESIQDPAKVGTALKTIASRLRGIGDEGEVVPTLAKDFKAVGVEIQNADGSFRNIYDVFEEFAVVYQTLDDLTKESLLEKLAGKRQKNIMIGLLENFDVAQMALEEAMDSAGAVAQANEKYLDSLEGKTKVLTETWGEFLRQIGSSEGFKTGIDALTLIIKLVKSLTTGFGALIGALGGVAVAMSSWGLLLAGSVSAVIPILGVALALFSGLNFFIEATKSEFDRLNDSLTSTLSKISDLNSKVNELQNKKDITEAEQRYLAVLKEQLEVEEAKAKIQSDRISAINREKAVAEIEKVNKALENQNKIAEGIGETFKKGGKEYSILPDTDRDLAELDKLQTEMINLRSELLASAGDFEANEESIKLVDIALANIKKRYAELGIVLKEEVVVEMVATKNAQQRLSESLQDAKSLLSGATSDYQILSDSLYQLETQGYLTEEMLASLLLAYPDIITQTGLVAEAVQKYANAEEQSTNRIIDSKIQLLKVQKKTFEEQIKLYEASMRLLAYDTGTNDELMYAAQFALSSGVIGNAFAAVRNAENAIAQLENAKKVIQGITKSRNESLLGKSAVEETKKVIESLTAQERALRDINQQIALLQKKYARTTDSEEQIKINNQLIAQYKLQRKTLVDLRNELEKNNATVKEGDEGYDDYIDQLYAFSLQIEDATNNIFSLTNANNSLIETMKESVNELRTMLRQLIEQELKDEIESHKELIKTAKEQLDIKLKQIEAEKDLVDFAKDRAKKEKDLSKIVSKMDSLRAAASQGDMKAINELAILEEQRVGAQEDLDTMINDRSYELRKENLQNQFNEFETTQQKEIAVLEKNLNDASYILKRSNDYMTSYLSGNMDSLYQNLVDWNSVYGTGFEADVISKWEKAIQMVQKFNSLSTSGGGFDFGDYNPSTSQKDSVIAEMKINRDLWASSDTETRKALNERNIALASSIGYSYRPDGNYYSDADGSKLNFDSNSYSGSTSGLSAQSSSGVLSTNAIASPTVKSSGTTMGDFNVYIESVTDNNVARIERTLKETVQMVSQGQLDAFKQWGYVPTVQIK